MNKKFSIIIPTLNEERFIGKCLASIDRLNCPKSDLEVIIVDNGSTDSTLSIAKLYNARIFIKEHCNVSELRNFGAGQATHPILAFVDADCCVPQNWIKDLQVFLDINGVGAVGCWYKLPDNPTWVEKVWDIHMFNRRNTAGKVNWIPSGNFVISKEVFSKIHGFDEFLITSEDVDICDRIQKSGLFIYSHPNLAIEHLGEPNSINKYFKKESWRGEGVYQNFLRSLPQLRLNKALLLAFLNIALFASLLVGIGIYSISGSLQILAAAITGLIAVPLLLSVKTLMTKDHWDYLLPLAFLFFLYSLARASSFFKPRVWISQFK